MCTQNDTVKIVLSSLCNPSSYCRKLIRVCTKYAVYNVPLCTWRLLPERTLVSH